MLSARVWGLAGAAGIAVFVWSLIASGVTYDQRQVEIEETTRTLAASPGDILAWNRLASLVSRGPKLDVQIDRWRHRAPQRLLDEQAGEAMLLYRVGSYVAQRSDEFRARAAELLEAFVASHPERATYYHWHTLAHAYRQLDRPAEALEASNHTEATAKPLVVSDPSPNLALVLNWLGQIRHDLGDHEGGVRAWAMLIHVLDAIGEQDGQRGAYTWQGLAETAQRAGDKVTVLSALDRYFTKIKRQGDRRLPPPDALSRLGWKFHEIGEESRAQEVWSYLALKQQALATHRPGNPTVLYNLACFAALAGDRETALDAWRDALAAGFDNLALADRDRDLASLRNLRRFTAPLAARAVVAAQAKVALPEGRAELWYIAARNSALAGDRDGALDAMAHAITAGFLSVNRLRSDRAFDPIRADATFGALQKRVSTAFDERAERMRRTAPVPAEPNR